MKSMNRTTPLAATATPAKSSISGWFRAIPSRSIRPVKSKFLSVVCAAALVATANAQSLPSSYDLSSEMPPIGDQQVNRGRGGTACQLWAAAETLTQYVKHFEHPEWDLTNPQHQFSPSFINNAYTPIPGVTYSEPITELTRVGGIAQSIYPYENFFTDAGVTTAERQSGLLYRVTGLNTLWDYAKTQTPPIYSTSQTLIDQAKSYIVSGHVLDVLLRGDNLMFPDTNGYPAMNFYDPVYPTGANLTSMGHQVVFCAYNDNINPSATDPDHRGGFLMANSEGANWNGDMHGYLWVSYAYVEQYVAECSVITSIVSDTPVITGLDVSQGKPGDVVSICGVSFGGELGDAKVLFNGIQATNLLFLNNSIEAVVPDGATSGELVVYNLNGLSSNAVEFTVVPEPSTGLIALGVMSTLMMRRRKRTGDVTAEEPRRHHSRRRSSYH